MFIMVIMMIWSRKLQCDKISNRTEFLTKPCSIPISFDISYQDNLILARPVKKDSGQSFNYNIEDDNLKKKKLVTLFVCGNIGQWTI